MSAAPKLRLEDLDETAVDELAARIAARVLAALPVARARRRDEPAPASHLEQVGVARASKARAAAAAALSRRGHGRRLR